MGFPEGAAEELAEALPVLQARCFSEASSWLAELLWAFGGEAQDSAGADTPPALLLAQTFMETGEFARCAQTLQARGEHEESPLGLFLFAYATFRRAESAKIQHSLEKWEELSGIRETDSKSELCALLDVFVRLSQDKPQLMDGPNWWLFGRVSKEIGLQSEAQDRLQRSLDLFPWNWVAWSDLAEVWENRDEDEEERFSCHDHWMADFFRALLLLRGDRAIDAAHIFAEADTALRGRSSFLVAQLALCAYSLNDHDTAEAHFERLLRLDPFRLENIEVYAEILFGKGNRVSLGDLARRLHMTAKYAPVTPLVSAHYMALCGDHQRAITTLKRVLRLNPKYTVAWVLLGHEYVETLDWRAGVAAYRTAVDLEPADVRGWLTLAHAFELVKQYSDAINCYKRAAALRPNAAHVWVALGDCYHLRAPDNTVDGDGSEERARRKNAIRAFMRAEELSDGTDFRTLATLAQLFEAEKIAAISESKRRIADDEAAYWHKRLLDEADEESVEQQSTVDALEFLGGHLRRHQTAVHLDEAEACCVRLLDFADCRAKDTARVLLQEIAQLRKQ